jgi:hypothetical protein
MPIVFTCTCGKKFRVGDEHAGKKTKCRQCGKTLVVPLSTDAPTPTTPPVRRGAPPPRANVAPSVQKTDQMVRVGSGTGLMAPVQAFWILGTETGHPIELYVAADKIIIKYVFPPIYVFLSLFAWVFWIGHLIRSRKYPKGREIPLNQIDQIEINYVWYKVVKTTNNPKTRVRYIVRLHTVDGKRVTLAAPLTNSELRNFKSLSWIQDIVQGP